jgi:hypothetical protein
MALQIQVARSTTGLTNIGYVVRLAALADSWLLSNETEVLITAYPEEAAVASYNRFSKLLATRRTDSLSRNPLVRTRPIRSFRAQRI